MKLFDPISIRGMILKNRIVFPPMLIMHDYQSPIMENYFLERARGGAGALIIGYTHTDLLLFDEAWRQIGGRTAHLSKLNSLTNQIHQTGAKIGIQISHGNKLSLIANRLRHQPNEWTAPSPKGEEQHPLRAIKIPPRRELTIQEIQTIISKFAAAAKTIKEAGFDFVELHNAHGHLPCQFFSPVDNYRTDEYGGDKERRMRFGLECVRAIRSSVGNGYPIFVRLASKEDRPNGIQLDDSITYAVELQKAGADVIDVSVGSSNNPWNYISYISPTKKSPMGTFAHLAKSIKAKVTIPVVAVGRINKPEVAEAILSDCSSDLVAIGRQLIADPYWPQKAFRGHVSEIIECDSCNHCWRALRGLSDFFCRRNPNAGREGS